LASPPGYTADAFLHYATKGYQSHKEPALGWASSPYGPWGMAKFYALSGVDAVVAMHEPLAKKLGVPSQVVLFALLLVGVMASTAALMACAVWLGPPKKRAAAQERPHRD